MNTGNSVLKKIKKEISDRDWNRYMQHITYSEDESRDTVQQFYAPNILLAKWIKTKYKFQLSHLFELETKLNQLLLSLLFKRSH